MSLFSEFYVAKTFMNSSTKLEWEAEVEVAPRAWHGRVKLAEEERDIWS